MFIDPKFIPTPLEALKRELLEDANEAAEEADHDRSASPPPHRASGVAGGVRPAAASAGARTAGGTSRKAAPCVCPGKRK
jgi:hypothetical protein